MAFVRLNLLGLVMEIKLKLEPRKSILKCYWKCENTIEV